MARQSRLAVFCSSFIHAMGEGIRKIPLWAALVQITVILCCIFRPEIVLTLSIVLTIGTILKAGKFGEKYSKGVKNLPVDVKTEDD